MRGALQHFANGNLRVEFEEQLDKNSIASVAGANAVQFAIVGRGIQQAVTDLILQRLLDRLIEQRREGLAQEQQGAAHDENGQNRRAGDVEISARGTREEGLRQSDQRDDRSRRRVSIEDELRVDER